MHAEVFVDGLSIVLRKSPAPGAPPRNMGGLELIGAAVDFETDGLGLYALESDRRTSFTQRIKVEISDVNVVDVREDSPSKFTHLLVEENDDPFMTTKLATMHSMLRLVGNRPLKSSAEEDVWTEVLLTLLEQYGQISTVYINRGLVTTDPNADSNANPAVAYVEFAEIEACSDALVDLQRHQTHFAHAIRFVDWATVSSDMQVAATMSNTKVYVTVDFLSQLIEFVPDPGADAASTESADDAAARGGAGGDTPAHAPTSLDGLFSRLSFGSGGDREKKFAGDDFECPALGNIDANIKVAEQRLFLLEDETQADTQAIALVVSADVTHKTRGEDSFTSAKLHKVAAQSYKMDQQEDTHFDIIPEDPPFQMNAMRIVGKRGKNETVNIKLDPLSINIGSKDLVTLNIVAEKLGTLGGDEDKPTWDEVAAVATPKTRAIATVAGDGTAKVEHLFLAADTINVTYVNNLGGRDVALMMASVRLRNWAAENWSSELTVAGHLDLAAAAMCPRTLTWQPLLVGPPRPKSKHAQALTLELEVNSARASWVPQKGHAVEPKTMGSNKSTDQKHPAPLVLSSDPETYWSGGTHKGAWIAFDLGQLVTLQQLRFVANIKRHGCPGACEIFVSNEDLPVKNKERGMPKMWVSASKFSVPQPKSPTAKFEYVTEPFSATGRYVKLLIHSAKHKPKLHSVDFKVIRAGTNVLLSAGASAEITVTSSFVAGLTSASNELQNAVASVADDSQKVGFTAEGSHEVVNLTGFEVKVCRGNEHDDEHAFTIKNGGRAGMSFDNAPGASFGWDAADIMPIVDIDVVNIKGARVPDGWESIPTSLTPRHSNKAIDNRLVFKRGTDRPAITDIWVRYDIERAIGSSSGSRGDPLPAGFEELPHNVSARGTGTKICFRRGNGPAVVEFAVLHSTNWQDHVPQGFTAIDKNVNLGGNANNTCILAVKSEKVQLAPGIQVIREANGQPLVTELCAVMSREELEMLAKEPVPQGYTAWQPVLAGGRPERVRLGEPVDEAGLDLSQGANKYLLFRHNPELAPITQVEVIRGAHVPDYRRLRKHAAARGMQLLCDKACEIDFSSSHRGGPTSFLGIARDKCGGAPILAVGLKRCHAPAGSDLDAAPGHLVVQDAMPIAKDYRKGKSAHTALTLLRADVAPGTFEPAVKEEKKVSKAGAAGRHAPNDQLLALEVIERGAVSQPTITIEVEGWQPLTNIHLDDHGRIQNYVLKPVWRVSPARLCISVSEDRGVALVTLSSPLVLENSMDVPMEVCVQQELHDERTQATLEPDESLPFPLGFCDNVPGLAHKVVPLRRFFSASSGNFFCTVDPLELDRLPGTDWVEQTILGYLNVEQLPDQIKVWSSRPSARVPFEISGIGAESEQVLLEEGSPWRLLGYGYAEAAPGRIALETCTVGRATMHTSSIATRPALPAALPVADSRKGGTVCYLTESVGSIRVRPAPSSADGVVGGVHDWSKSSSINPVGTCSGRIAHCGRGTRETNPYTDLGKATSSDTTAAGRSSFHCVLLNGAPNVTFIAPWVHLGNRLPYKVRCGLTATADAPPAVWRVIPEGETAAPVLTDAGDEGEIFMWVSLFTNNDTPSAWSKPARVSSRPHSDVEDALGGCAEHILLSLSVGGSIMQLALELHVDPRGAGSRCARHIDLCCPFVVYNETGVALDIVDGQMAQCIWRPLDASNEDPGLLSIPEDRAESVSIVTPSRQAHGLSLAFSGAAQKVVLTQHSKDSTLEERFAQKTAALPASSAERIRAANGEDASVSLMLKSGGGAAMLFEEVHIVPTFKFINASSELVSLLYQPDPTSDTPQPAAFSVTLEPGSARPVTAGKDMPGSWCLFDPASHRLSTPFNPTNVSMSMTVKFLNTGEFKALVVKSKQIYEQHEVQICDRGHVPPVQFRNFCKSTDVRIVQSGTKLGVQRVLDSGMHLDLCPDDSTLEVKYKVSVVDPDSTDAGAVAAVPAPVIIGTDEPKPRFLDPKAGSVILTIDDPDTGGRVIMFADGFPDARMAMGLEPLFEDEVLALNVMVQLPQVGVSLIDMGRRVAGGSTPQEVMYLALEDIGLEMYNSNHFTKLHLNIRDIQIDSSDRDAHFPVLLSRAEPDSKTPVLRLSKVDKLGQIGAERRGFPSVHSMAFSLQKLEVFVDGTFLGGIFDFMENMAPPATEAAQRAAESAAALVEEQSALAKQIEPSQFFKQVDAGSIDMAISLDLSDLKPGGPPVVKLLSRFGLGMSALADFPVKINAVSIRDKFFPQSELIAKITEVYTSNVLKWLMSKGVLRGLLSLEVLGNPGQVFNTVGSGFKSLFVDPAKALVKGPEQFGKSLGGGAVDFTQKGVGAVGSLASSLSGTAGKLAATMALDADFAKSRADNLKNVTSVSDGAVKGVKQFGRGLFEGVTGLVTQPIKGAKKDGFLGALKGAGKGVFGLAFKPAAGAIDVISGTMAGLKASTLGTSTKERFRAPRHVSPYGVVKDYSPDEAQGVAFIREHFRGRAMSVKGQSIIGKYAKYMYVGHVCEDVSHGRTKMFNMFMVLKHKILMITASDLADKSDKHTEVQIELNPADVMGAKLLPDKGLELKLVDSSVVVFPTNDDGTSKQLQTMVAIVATGDRGRQPPLGTIKPLYQQTVEEQLDAAAASQSRSAPEAAPAPAPDDAARPRDTCLVYQNQRGFPIIGWGKKMLPTDRPRYTMYHKGSVGFERLEDVNPPAGYEWDGEWELNTKPLSGRRDKDGWEYAIDFNSTWSHKKGLRSVRRRVLARDMVPSKLARGNTIAQITSGRVLQPRTLFAAEKLAEYLEELREARSHTADPIQARASPMAAELDEEQDESGSDGKTNAGGAAAAAADEPRRHGGLKKLTL